MTTKAETRHRPSIVAVALGIVLAFALGIEAPPAFADESAGDRLGASALDAGALSEQTLTTQFKVWEFGLYARQEGATIYLPTMLCKEAFSAYPNAKTKLVNVPERPYGDDKEYTSYYEYTFQFRYTQTGSWKDAKTFVDKSYGSKRKKYSVGPQYSWYHIVNNREQNSTAYILRNLKAGATLKVQMRVLNRTGWSKWSEAQEVRIKGFADGTVENVAVTEVVKNSKIKITWDKVEGAKKYQVRLTPTGAMRRLGSNRTYHYGTPHTVTPEIDATPECELLYIRGGTFKNSSVVGKTREDTFFIKSDYASKSTCTVRMRYKDANGVWSRWSEPAKVTLHMPLRKAMTTSGKAYIQNNSDGTHSLAVDWNQDKKYKSGEYRVLCKFASGERYYALSMKLDKEKTLHAAIPITEDVIKAGKDTATCTIRVSCCSLWNGKKTWMSRWSKPIKLTIHRDDF